MNELKQHIKIRNGFSQYKQEDYEIVRCGHCHKEWTVWNEEQIATCEFCLTILSVDRSKEEDKIAIRTLMSNMGYKK
jgi:uncharacterized CHY-type Zn-finger protein